MELLRAEASRLYPSLTTEGAKHFLIASSWLPLLDDRDVYYDKATRRARTPEEYAKMTEEERVPFVKRTLSEQFFYHTRYGSPMAYARPLDLLCNGVPERAGIKPSSCFTGKKIFDYGFGGIGHLRLLALVGAEAVGVDIDELLKAYYRDPTDTGEIEGAPFGGEPGPAGKLRLLYGLFPRDETLRAAGGEGYDYVISKNTLKKGYISPEPPPGVTVDPRTQVDLSVGVDEFVGHIARILKPGGRFMIYNICPAQNPEKFIPWADGRSPFPKEMLEKHGLRVIEFDKDDSAAARKAGEALEWNIGPQAMDLAHDLFAMYTLCERVERAKSDK
jgi:SAM-dependent methyltransferase